MFVNLHLRSGSSLWVESQELRYVKLRGADLSGANLRGTNLHWADLRGAELPTGYSFIYVGQYDVTITPEKVFIGCKSMVLDDWLGPDGLEVAKEQELSAEEIDMYRRILHGIGKRV